MTNFDKLLEKSQEYGEVMQVKHPIAILEGLPGARLHEMIIFENGILGEVFAILRDQVQVAILSREPIALRTKATYLDKFLSVPVGYELFGHSIDPLGRPFSNERNFKKPKEEREIDMPPTGISTRAKIDKPLLTGTTIVDIMLPLGKGQKELVIGDRKTGKTGFMFSAMKNQARLGTKVIYAAVASQQNEIKRAQEYFKKENVFSDIVIVATLAHDSPSLIFLTPYAAMALAEYFRDQGEDVLVVFDDLSAHAKFYREISLVARRFPGRDSFPGDIFYIHAKLLERAGNFKTSKGNKSVSVLAAVEVTEGDFTGFISTNLMSITDGHILFDNNIFHQGQRPAVNVSLSVTRVGRQAQTPLIRDINKELTVFLNKYDKMENLAHFGAELTGEAKMVLQLGNMLKKLFQEGYGEIMPFIAQLLCLIIIWQNWVIDEKIFESIKKAFMEQSEKDLEDPWIKEIISKTSLKEVIDFTKPMKDKFEKICSKFARSEIKFDVSAKGPIEGIFRAPSKPENGINIPGGAGRSKEVSSQNKEGGINLPIIGNVFGHKVNKDENVKKEEVKAEIALSEEELLKKAEDGKSGAALKSESVPKIEER